MIIVVFIVCILLAIVKYNVDWAQEIAINIARTHNVNRITKQLSLNLNKS